MMVQGQPTGHAAPHCMALALDAPYCGPSHPSPIHRPTYSQNSISGTLGLVLVGRYASVTAYRLEATRLMKKVWR